MVKVGIAGVTGYTGICLLRLLLAHSKVSVSYLFSTSKAGDAISDLFPQFAGKCHLTLQPYDPARMPEDMDVLFLAVPHGQTQSELPQMAQNNPNLKIIDLSADFRIHDADLYEEYYSPHRSATWLDKVVYGVPELNREDIKTAKYVANPGCYAIASVLGLYPIKHLIGSDVAIIIDAKSGVTGAGRSLKEGSLFCEANESISAYSMGRHRHMAEITQEIGTKNVSFFPHLSPQNVGILAGIYLPNKNQINQSDLTALYNNAYNEHPFTLVNDKIATPSTKYVVDSNNCLITPLVTPDGKTIAIFSAIDNLLKGASGQAVQNMNLMCGFNESEGLPEVASYV
ncbi:MAG: N-acetyl-gamma-glutamyl-phosphate reductase [bacterium]|nr:N-acetyl-gamma-glutamyl-phosphate reductase [bacterium]